METVALNGDDLKLVVPFSLMISGPTSCGRTFRVYQFLKQFKDLIKPRENVPEKSLFCYSIDQPLYKTMANEIQGIQFFQGLPTLDTIVEISDNGPVLIVLDDLVHKIVNDQDMLLLFTQGSHHRNISVIFMTQNLYYGGKNARSIALNVKYMVLFANPRDSLQIKYLGRQLFPSDSRGFYEAYIDAIRTNEWGYLFIDLFMEHQII